MGWFLPDSPQGKRCGMQFKTPQPEPARCLARDGAVCPCRENGLVFQTDLEPGNSSSGGNFSFTSCSSFPHLPAHPVLPSLIFLMAWGRVINSLLPSAFLMGWESLRAVFQLPAAFPWHDQCTCAGTGQGGSDSQPGYSTGVTVLQTVLSSCILLPFLEMAVPQ